MGQTVANTQTAYAVEMKNIVKKFGDFVANDHVNLSVK